MTKKITTRLRMVMPMLRCRKIRNSEYYGMYGRFDELYEQSQKGNVFTHLFEDIISDNNILLAYRNIKRNSGSHTAGVDNRTIDDINKLSDIELIDLVRKRLSYYRPNPVRRVEIPKPNGKTRPLGIPTILDRIIQQCFLQVLEPICEARFYEHSYGFRPNRSAENAVAMCYRHLQYEHLYYVVDIDIKGFFDNINHSKLIKQMWAMGIRDKKVLSIIKAMLKAEIVMPNGEIVIPNKGTPQGGLISPLLANIVLNELDWWIASQWENVPTEYPYKVEFKGVVNNGNKYVALRKSSNLKEVYIVRYADDFKLFCRNRNDALRIFEATKQWLKDRLKLEISPEKSKVVNTKRRYSEFLGFKIKVREKSGTYRVGSKMCDKARERVARELIEQIEKCARATDDKDEYKQLYLYNTKVWGIHNYYCIATDISKDASKIAFRLERVQRNRYRNRLSKTGKPLNRYMQQKYGKSKRIRYLSKEAITPFSYIQTKNPMCKKKSINKYSPQGREEIHKMLKEVNVDLIRQMVNCMDNHRSIQYQDNRIALYIAQKGKCAITGEELQIDDVHCHHKKPRYLGGTDEYSNLIIVKKDIHRLIHCADIEQVKREIAKYNLDGEKLKKFNKLRLLAEQESI